MKVLNGAAKIHFTVSLFSRIILRCPGHFFDLAAPVLWPYVVHDGIKILDPRPAIRENFTKLVKEGLEFIAIHDPRRYKRVCREIRLIMHLPTPTGAHYSRPFKVCCLDEETFRLAKELHGSVGALACTLVHESVHGYLFSKKILQRRKTYNRVEDICNRSMLRFAERARFETEGWIDGAVSPIKLTEQFQFSLRKAAEIWAKDRQNSSPKDARDSDPR